MQLVFHYGFAVDNNIFGEYHVAPNGPDFTYQQQEVCDKVKCFEEPADEQGRVFYRLTQFSINHNLLDFFRVQGLRNALPHTRGVDEGLQMFHGVQNSLFFETQVLVDYLKLAIGSREEFSRLLVEDLAKLDELSIDIKEHQAKLMKETD